MTIDELAKTVLYHRKRSGLSREALAKLAGVGKTVVYDIENGKETVQLNSLLKILTVLNIQFTIENPFKDR